MYERVIKRLLDIIVSAGALVCLSWLFLIIAIAVIIDDPGPVFFSQKRVGKDMKYFKLYKFRSMKMSAPHETPTHLLKNPNQYITRVGRFCRKTSLDELPQLWNILVGSISVIGPRPALWNQADLLAERDKYGANSITPGLTGWAQINGRDGLTIEAKAKYDGEYAEKLKAGGWKAFAFDCRCFFGTIRSVLKREGVVEGGAGEMKKQEAEKR